MAFNPQTYVITTTPQSGPIVPDSGPFSAAVIANIGDGVDYPGPDTALLTSTPGSGDPLIFVLRPGASLAFPADIGAIYAIALNTTTTLTVAIATR